MNDNSDRDFGCGLVGLLCAVICVLTAVIVLVEALA
jgi:hypothetical protein